jgi:hexokinase
MAQDGIPYLQAALSALTCSTRSGTAALLEISDALVASYDSQLQTSKESMLPSFTHELPDGTEHGTTVALDLGGSTLRVAVISLRPHKALGGSDRSHLGEVMSVLERRSWMVDDKVKKLPSREFFDWIAERIAIVVSAAGAPKGQAMSMGVTWSFPVEPTSAASGKIQQMGKGYTQWMSIADTDLKSHFDAAFMRKGLSLRMTALVNDAEATLLSHAYANPATRIAVIWGTGINAAVYLPIERVSQHKLGVRPKNWTENARAVVVNTELSMYGAGIFPVSEADVILDRNSSQPGFQPLEQMTSGRYLGEILRLLILGATTHGELFRGQLPEGLSVPFSLDTASMNTIEE